MGARILSLLAVLVLVAGCSSTPKDEGSVTTNGDLTASDQMPMTDVTADTMGNGVAPGTSQDLVVNVGDRVFFGYDQYDLTIEGHCDERGTREYNLALGEKRAMAVRNYLIALGVEPGRIQTISYGKERPAVLGSDDTSWAQNRRGVVVVQ
jgi:peptidoglycan-associated lipoprotein